MKVPTALLAGEWPQCIIFDHQLRATVHYDAFVFDFDGVLADSVEVKTRAFAKLFDEKLLDRRRLLKLPLPRTFEELEHAEDASRVIQDVAERLNKFQGHDMPSCQGTAWGAFTAIVDFMDHERGHNTDTRLERTWIGSDVKVKKQALDLAELMATKN